MRVRSVVLVVVVFLVTALAAGVGFSPERSGRLDFWLIAGTPPVILGAIALVWAKSEDLLYEWLAPRWGDFTRGWMGACLLFAAAWLFAHAVTPVGSPREVWLVSLYGQLGDPRILQAHAVEVGVAIVVATLGEEVVWRGMVTHLLAERFGSRRAWLYGAALYGLAVVPTIWTLRVGSGCNPVLFVAAMGGGFLWAAMARAFGNLVPSILAHALFDWAVIMMFPLWGGRFGAASWLHKLG